MTTPRQNTSVEAEKWKYKGTIVTGIMAVVTSIIGTVGTIQLSEGKVSALQKQTENVEDRVKAVKAGIPAGTIIAYGGPVDASALRDKGWLLCDGTEVSISEFKPLFDEIGTSWGGDGIKTFRLPDLRGMFLRGVNSRRSNSFPGMSGPMDPGAEDRVSLYMGGHYGNDVGSFQPDEAGPHRHAFRRGLDPKFGADGIALGSGSVEDPLSDKNTGKIISNLAAETRPKNAYVHFLIKR